MICSRAAWWAAFASLLGMLTAPALLAQENGPVVRRRSAPPIDVALVDGRVLQGQLLSPAGEPIADATLTLLDQGEVESKVRTDRDGRFRCAAPRGGIYQLIARGQQTTIRAWTADAAPPGCHKRLIVVRGDVLRGQSRGIPYTQINPWLVAGVVAAAVAIPVVLSNHRSDRGDGS